MQLADFLRANGLPCFPSWVRYDGKKWEKGPAVPRNESWKLTAHRPVSDPLLDWSSGVVGVPIPPGVLVFDVDSYKGADLVEIERWLGTSLDWRNACIQRTIGGGEHYAFRCDFDARQLQNDAKAPQGLDTRAAGKGFICTGAGYQQVGEGVLAMLRPESLPALPDSVRACLEVVTAPARVADTDVETEDIVAALTHIDPGCNRAEWIRVVMALKHGYQGDDAQGMEIADRWSSGEWWHAGTPHNYVAEHIESQWSSLSVDGGVTLSTLFYKALQGGWTPPRDFDTSGAFVGAFERLIGDITACGGDPKQVPKLVQEIQQANCSQLQRALLAAELKNALKDAGIKDAQVGKQVDAALRPPKKLEGETPAAGKHLDDNTPLHPSAWAPMHTKGKEQKPKATMRNFEIMLDAYGVRIEFNEIGKELKISGPTVPGAGVLHEEAALTYLESLANLNEYPAGSVRSMIMPIANRNTINPVRDWVSSSPWSGHDHVGELWGQIALADGEDPAFAEMLFRKWIRGAYAIGTGLISRWEYVFVLVDPAGGAGKTRFFATLCPKELRTDSVILDTTNRDGVKLAISYWLTELGELDGTFSRSDHTKLKAFLSLESDEMRLAYGRAYLKYPRRTAFFASVNEPNYLIDQSDNRRYWGVTIRWVNYNHTICMQQVWAQAAAEIAQGAQWYLTPEEDRILRSRNEAYRSNSRVTDILGSLYITVAPQALLTVSELLAMGGMGTPTKSDLNEAARWLRRNGYCETRRGNQRGFAVHATSAPPEVFKPAIVK